jgi:hypothetical protein
MKSKIFAAIMLVIIALTAYAGKIDPRLRSVGEEYVTAWVFFEDKAVSKGDEGRIARGYLSERAIARRVSAGIAIDEKDVPVEESYISRIEGEGAVVRRQSRWLNAASFQLPARALDRIAELDFVREIRPVTRYVRSIPEPRERPFPDGGPDDFYGYTKNQLEMIAVTDLHDMGYYGQGVLVGMLDSGFRTTHKAFDSLDLVAAYDFIHNDESVDYDSVAGDLDYTGYRHGTQTLGCVAGYLPGIYIGAAYRASVALAKTEDVSAEYVTEEDNWVAGIEWLDSLGADIVSSSLGYSDFDTDTPYTFEDMDGNTAITTIAADIAASRGICVVNSAGNERNSHNWPHIIAPADGDSVLAVAAVNPLKMIASFSSPGPSADGRIKPDVSATGYLTVLVNTEDTIGVNLWGAGTSFSCPLIAGLCAAVKSANPSLGGYDLALAVRSSGERVRAYDPAFPVDSADNDYGWGIPKGPVAAGIAEGFYCRLVDAANGQLLCFMQATLNYGGYSRTFFSDTFGILVDPIAEAGETLSLSVPGFYSTNSIPIDGVGRTIYLERLGNDDVIQVFPNPASENLVVLVFEGEKAQFTVYSSDGSIVHDQALEFSTNKRFIWDMKSGSGSRIANGTYIVRVATEKDEIVRKIAVVR